MALVDDIKKLLDEFGVSLNDDTRSSLKQALDARAAKHKGRKRTSRLEASVKPVVEFKGGAIKLTLQMNDYWEVVNDGRSPNNVSEDGQEKLQKWSELSGLAEKIRVTDLQERKERQSLSKRKSKLKSLKKMPFDRAKKAAGFLVARSLKKKSIEATHFFDKVIEDGRVQELEDRLTELIKTDIIVEIRSSYK